MQNKTYEFYLFDLDRTLWSFDKNAKRAIFRLIDEYSLFSLLRFTDKELFFNTYEKINHRLWNEYEAGKITKEELRSRRFYETCREIAPAGTVSEEEFKILAVKFGEAYLNQMTYETELEPHAKEVLATIKQQGGKIGILSNGFKEVQYRKLKNSGLMEYIDVVLTSEEAGVHKPSPVIFRKVLESLAGERYHTERQAVKQATLMVGDDFANDIEGAQVFGIDQFYYNPNHKLCLGGPTYQSDTLLTLLSLKSRRG